jgi:hypothetical protein
MHSSIKVITITGLIILGIVLDLGGKFIDSDPTRVILTLFYFIGGPNHDRLGFRYWKKPGPFVQYDGIKGAKGQFLGYFAVLTQAAFSFIGTEIVAVSTLWILFGRPRFHCINTRSLPAKLKILDATSQRPSKESTFVSPSVSCRVFFIYLP